MMGRRRGKMQFEKRGEEQVGKERKPKGGRGETRQSKA